MEGWSRQVLSIPAVHLHELQSSAVGTQIGRGFAPGLPLAITTTSGSHLYYIDATPYFSSSNRGEVGAFTIC